MWSVKCNPKPGAARITDNSSALRGDGERVEAKDTDTGRFLYGGRKDAAPHRGHGA